MPYTNFSGDSLALLEPSRSDTYLSGLQGHWVRLLYHVYAICCHLVETNTISQSFSSNNVCKTIPTPTLDNPTIEHHSVRTKHPPQLDNRYSKDPYRCTKFSLFLLLLATLMTCSVSQDLDMASVSISSRRFRIIGAAASDFSGSAVSGLGDVNGDKIPDVIVGAFGADPSGDASAGISYVIYGRNVARQVTNPFVDVQLTTGVTALAPNIGFRISGAAAGEFSGRSVSGAGDLNNDGINDILVGAQNAATSAMAIGGIAYVIFGRNITGGATAFGNIQLTSSGSDMAPGVGFRILGAQDSDRCGCAVNRAGDVNHDGIDDIIVGAYSAAARKGISYVIYGRSTAFTDIQLTTSALSPTIGFRILGAVDDDESGTAVNGAGDVNGDGVDDVIVGANGAATLVGGAAAGITYIIFGRNIPGGDDDFGDVQLTNSANPLSPLTGFRLLGAGTTDLSGGSVAPAGDINNDGIGDILVGAHSANAPGGVDAGIAYVIFGRNIPIVGTAFGDIQLTSGGTSLMGGVGFRILGPAASDNAGQALSAAGDVNGDGIGDIIVGSRNSDPWNVLSGGMAYVIYGRDVAGGVAPFTDIQLTDGGVGMLPSIGFRILGAAAYAYCGSAVSFAGDVNNDGIDDIIVGSNGRSSSAGHSYVIFGTALAPTSQPSSQPSRQPSRQPFGQPSRQPSTQPTRQPSSQPSRKPSGQPTAQPSRQPVSRPSALPSSQPSRQPSERPSKQPSGQPSKQPSGQPSRQPSRQPSAQPTAQPSRQPSAQPSNQPSGQPSRQPAAQPSGQPSNEPTKQPTRQPSSQPSTNPSSQPSRQPSGQPSAQPRALPSNQPSSQPTFQPSTQPTRQPSGQPSRQPTAKPSVQPSSQPTRQPSTQPTRQPSGQPSGQPSARPTAQPSRQPSMQPSRQPTEQPSRQPSAQPTTDPSRQPSSQPSGQPTGQPTSQPTCQPSRQPTNQPSRQPSTQPSTQPSSQPNSKPSSQPSTQPSRVPSMQPSVQPSKQPSRQPSARPTSQPSGQPSNQPSCQPSVQPSTQPSAQPSRQPSSQPTQQPTTQPSHQPSARPTSQPSRQPSSQPSHQPSGQPSAQPSAQPSRQPSSQPTQQPTTQPSRQPSARPTSQPSLQPSCQPSRQPSGQPSAQPSAQPSRQPSSQPTQQPTVQPSRQPSVRPTCQPSVQPSAQPSGQPSCQPSTQPTRQPSLQPTDQPTKQPSGQPSAQPSLQPSNRPSSQPSAVPTSQPSYQPRSHPSSQPSNQPTSQPSTQPTARPSAQPSMQPTSQPSSQSTTQPSSQPTMQPLLLPSAQPTSQPSIQPSSQPTKQPSGRPSAQPSVAPSAQPSVEPSRQPTVQPTSQPSVQPTLQPASGPTSQPTTQPSAFPSSQPTSEPTTQPTEQPSSLPSAHPSAQPSRQPSAQPTRQPQQPSGQPSAHPTQQPSTQPSAQPTVTPSAQPSVQPSLQPSAQPSKELTIGEWVSVVDNAESLTQVNYADNVVWVCGDCVQEGGDPFCGQVDAALGKELSRFPLPWGIVTSVWQTDAVRIAIVGKTSDDATVSTSMATCETAERQLVCASNTFHDTNIEVASYVPVAKQTIYIGLYRDQMFASILDNVVGTFRSFLYSGSTNAMKTISITHAQSPLSYVGTFVAGTCLSTASVNYIYAGVIRADSGIMTAMYVLPTRGSILNAAGLVNAMALEEVKPDSFIAGGLLLNDGAGLNAYMVRVNSFFNSVEYGVRYVAQQATTGSHRRALSEQSTRSSVAKSLVLAESILFMIVDVSPMNTNSRNSVCIAKVELATGLILEQVQIESATAALHCSRAATSTAPTVGSDMFLYITCKAVHHNSTEQILLSVNQDLSLSVLPRGFRRYQNETLRAERILFKRVFLPLSTRSATINSVESTFLLDNLTPTPQPSPAPTSRPSAQPSCAPSGQPSSLPTSAPSVSPQPTNLPSTSGPTNTYKPSVKPSQRPSTTPSREPTTKPSKSPTRGPTTRPTIIPSAKPSTVPSVQLTKAPTRTPSARPTRTPTLLITNIPTELPTPRPSITFNTERRAYAASTTTVFSYVVGGLIVLWLLYLLRKFCLYKIDKLKGDEKLMAHMKAINLPAEPRYPIFSALVALFCVLVISDTPGLSVVEFVVEEEGESEEATLIISVIQEDPEADGEGDDLGVEVGENENNWEIFPINAPSPLGAFVNSPDFIDTNDSIQEDRTSPVVCNGNDSGGQAVETAFSAFTGEEVSVLPIMTTIQEGSPVVKPLAIIGDTESVASVPNSENSSFLSDVVNAMLEDTLGSEYNSSNSSTNEDSSVSTGSSEMDDTDSSDSLSEDESTL